MDLRKAEMRDWREEQVRVLDALRLVDSKTMEDINHVENGKGEEVSWSLRRASIGGRADGRGSE